MFISCRKWLSVYAPVALQSRFIAESCIPAPLWKPAWCIADTMSHGRAHGFLDVLAEDGFRANPGTLLPATCMNGLAADDLHERGCLQRPVGAGWRKRRVSHGMRHREIAFASKPAPTDLAHH
jgi:hypothetical protein